MHFIAIADGKIVSTARVKKMPKNEMKIERMATMKDYRDKGIGRELLEFMLKEIAKQKPKKIWTMSQVRSQSFYEKCGFKAVSKPFEMYGVQHINMEYQKK
jgi:predicted GNAT family N-acyltransferase